MDGHDYLVDDFTSAEGGGIRLGRWPDGQALWIPAVRPKTEQGQTITVMKKDYQKGFSLVEMLIVTLVIGVITAIVVPSLLQSKILANETSAISSMRSLATAEYTYEGTLGFGNFAADLTSLEGALLIDSVLASGTKDGYNFSLSGSAEAFEVEARPIGYRVSGTRSFFGDESGVIRFTTADAPATSSSPPL